ncbi:hypothetical protein DFH07DRAFT_895623 [Mycena maculata]|uniref:G-patch domain-containing protein n=1 Tax=Mycena maculata TaxID=230809 RepID=A0AAD7MS25_9AGAR|nr:hypothetical protein DFH07DRAFT_895623 [Mycena maculata]
MGLSGRKEKQRIGADPRNLSWADDAAKFGSSYLSKFGWDSSKGLGASGEGRISHIKVSQKLDMLGIGAAQQKDPNGIAWKQNKDFERLLERLNAGVAEEVKTEAVEGGEDDEKKRKREDGDNTAVKKKRRKSEPVAVVAAAVETAKPVVPRHRAHRARAIAAKNMASKSAASISEILGIAPTSSTPASSTPEGTLTPYDDGVPLEKLTTSTKSVADYFKDKLLAKAGKYGTATPKPSEDVKVEMDYEAPRGGLGSSRVKLEPTEGSVDPPTRMGLSKLSSMMASSFFVASTSVVVKEEVVAVKVEEAEVQKKKKRSSSEEEDDAKRKDNKNKQHRDESEPAVAVEAQAEAEKKYRRRDGESAVGVVDAPVKDASTDPVAEAERKKAKKEKKRLKALKKEKGK